MYLIQVCDAQDLPAKHQLVTLRVASAVPAALAVSDATLYVINLFIVIKYTSFYSLRSPKCPFKRLAIASEVASNVRLLSKFLYVVNYSLL